MNKLINGVCGGVLLLASMPMICADAMAQTEVKVPVNTAVTVVLNNEFGDIDLQGGNVCGDDLPFAGDGNLNFDPDAYVVTVSTFGSLPSVLGSISYAALIPFDTTGWTDAGLSAADANNTFWTYDAGTFGEDYLATITWSQTTQLISNTTTVQSCAGCEWNMMLFAAGEANFTIDVVGYYDNAGVFTPLDGCRVMDTRYWGTPTTTTTVAPTTTTTTVAPTTTTTTAVTTTT